MMASPILDSLLAGDFASAAGLLDLDALKEDCPQARSTLYSNRAFCYEHLGLNASAIKDLENAVNADPKNGNAYLSLAKLQLECKRIEDARVAFSKACLLQPSQLDFAALWAINAALSLTVTVQQCNSADPARGSAACFTEQHDILVTLAEKVDPWDLASLRLVDKTFHRAVGEAAMALTPSKTIMPSQLRSVCGAFRSVTSLDLSSTTQLTSASLALLPQLAPKLKVLNLSGSSWVSGSAILHLPALTRLSVLGLAALPAVVSVGFGSTLRRLKQLTELDLGRNQWLADWDMCSIAHLTLLTALKLGSRYPPQHRSFSASRLQSTAAALPRLLLLELPYWRELGTDLLLRIALHPGVTNPTLTAALEALRRLSLHHVPFEGWAEQSGIFKLLGFLEVDHWPPKDVKPTIQVHSQQL